ncbi:MAG TPA: mechanosensitive ion channel domain-containing protein [Gemmataceae bacterium]|nr:mechanosensitive ion channel domain-containing protein [Gemmataceae bacterium]
MSSFLEHVRGLLTESRLIANVTATYGTVAVLLILSLVVRRLIGHGGEHLAHWTGMHWLDGFGREAARRTRRVVAWLTWTAVLVLAVGGVVYHVLGRDVRQDFRGWYADITAERWLDIGLRAAGVAGLAVGGWLAVRVLQRLSALAEASVAARIGKTVTPEAVGRWFRLVRRFSIVAVCVGVIWLAGYVVHHHRLADHVIWFVLRVLSVGVAARLLTLTARAVTRLSAHAGDRYFARGRFKNYWERVKILIPFGERCFDAAVYVTAASLIAYALRFVRFMAEYGPPVVQCIGIFFASRVLIELAHVLLYEAFGLYKEGAARNQKEQTLVPLLHSICQYVIYFGAGMTMLKVLNMGDYATPIMAGAGVVGLAVGLGAQSLVTDVVSGFFILFEAQYLVGDYVQIGDAVGLVESVGIRVTQVRDARGKLYLIPNGQIKGVVNYSKGYINAVVDVKVPSGADLEATFRMMAEAGRRLKAERGEVLAETEIRGLVELGTSEMTVRAVTKVEPGTHEAMENEYRRLLKVVFEEARPAAPLKLAA